MKKILSVALLGLMSFGTYTSYAIDMDSESLLTPDELMQTAQQDDESLPAVDLDQTDDFSDLWAPGPHPGPHPVPPPHPPHPYPPYPAPGPYPPHPSGYTCFSRDYRGNDYAAWDYNPYEAQNRARRDCEYYSAYECRDLGCRAEY